MRACRNVVYAGDSSAQADHYAMLIQGATAPEVSSNELHAGDISQKSPAGNTQALQLIDCASPVIRHNTLYVAPSTQYSVALGVYGTTSAASWRTTT